MSERVTCASAERVRRLSPPGKVVLVSEARGRTPHNGRIRVLVGHGYPVFRAGLVAAVELRPELELVGEATDAGGALARIGDLRPDLALLDLRLPGLDSPKVLAALAPEETPTRVVFLYDIEDSEAVYQAIVAGAFGLLPKSTEPDKLCDALLAAARGSTGISYELQTAFIAEMRLRRQGGPALLTGREREILHLTADGLSVGQIAERLFLSPNTVKTHCQNLYAKLGVSDRAAAVAAGMRQGLLE